MTEQHEISAADDLLQTATNQELLLLAIRSNALMRCQIGRELDRRSFGNRVNGRMGAPQAMRACRAA